MIKSKTYPNIDMIKTGKKLKYYMESSNLTVKDIQEHLHLSCPQPIYRWIAGKVLPSVDHLLTLSELFDVHMEELLVKKELVAISEKIINIRSRKRLVKYINMLSIMKSGV